MIEETCTFKPEINTISCEIMKMNKQEEEVQDRLYNENKQRLFNKEKLR